MRLKNWIQLGQDRLKEIWEKPEVSVPWIQQLPRPLAGKILSYASELLEPSFWGTGLRLRDLSRDRIGLVLPLRRRQTLAGGEMQMGALLSASEWAFRMLWIQQSHLHHNRLEFLEGRVEVDSSLNHSVLLRGDLSSELLEKVQIELMQQGHCEEEWTLAVLNLSERQVGRVHLKLRWSSPPLLSARTPS